MISEKATKGKMIAAGVMIAISLAMIITWLGPGSAWWDKIDWKIFWACNNTLKGDTAWSYFWAFVNWRGFDAMGFSMIAVFSVVWLRAKGKTELSHRFMRLISYVLLVVIFWLITVACESTGPEGRVKDRLSPSRVVQRGEFVDLTYRLGWTRAKVKSHHCFPSDHAILALSMAAFFAMEGSEILGLISLFILGFLSVPRVFSGAHWMTDVVVGGIAVVLIICSIWLLTAAFRARILEKIERRCQKHIDRIAKIFAIGLKN